MMSLDVSRNVLVALLQEWHSGGIMRLRATQAAVATKDLRQRAVISAGPTRKSLPLTPAAASLLPSR